MGEQQVSDRHGDTDKRVFEAACSDRLHVLACAIGPSIVQRMCYVVPGQTSWLKRSRPAYRMYDHTRYVTL